SPSACADGELRTLRASGCLRGSGTVEQPPVECPHHDATVAVRGATGVPGPLPGRTSHRPRSVGRHGSRRPARDRPPPNTGKGDRGWPPGHFPGGLPSTDTPGTFFLLNSSLNLGRSSDSTRRSLASSSSVCWVSSLRTCSAW